MKRTPIRVAIAVVASLMVVGCGSGSEADNTPPPAPTETPSASMNLISSPPADYRAIKGDGYTIYAPWEYDEKQSSDSKAKADLVLESPSMIGGIPRRVVVTRDADAATGADAQSYALETEKTKDANADDVHRYNLLVPDGQSGLLVVWTEQVKDSGGAAVPVQFWQLFRQVDDKLVFTVVASAPAEEFESSSVKTVLRTFFADTPKAGS